ncbi:hypothetical protein BGX24_009961 [Mortierella sp. AD032]|nr:hypothetical protein BGX24_009961 [Mortierella sp. AD032]
MTSWLPSKSGPSLLAKPRFSHRLRHQITITTAATVMGAETELGPLTTVGVSVLAQHQAHQQKDRAECSLFESSKPED